MFYALLACGAPTTSISALDEPATWTESEAREGGPAFVAVSDDRGQRFVSTLFPEISLLLVDVDVPGYTVGLYPMVDDEVVGVWSERPWADAPGWISPIIAAPRGTPILGDGPLVLPLSGSEEHGCPADDLTVTVGVDASGVVFDVVGIPYLGLPLDTSFDVQHEAGRDTVDAAPWEKGQDATFSGLTTMTFASEELGQVSLETHSEVPWFQLQRHDDFMEGDFDHSCEQGVASVAFSLRFDL